MFQKGSKQESSIIIIYCLKDDSGCQVKNELRTAGMKAMGTAGSQGLRPGDQLGGCCAFWAQTRYHRWTGVRSWAGNQFWIQELVLVPGLDVGCEANRGSKRRLGGCSVHLCTDWPMNWSPWRCAFPFPVRLRPLPVARCLPCFISCAALLEYEANNTPPSEATGQTSG